MVLVVYFDVDSLCAAVEEEHEEFCRISRVRELFVVKEAKLCEQHLTVPSPSLAAQCFAAGSLCINTTVQYMNPYVVTTVRILVPQLAWIWYKEDLVLRDALPVHTSMSGLHIRLAVLLETVCWVVHVAYLVQSGVLDMEIVPLLGLALL